MASSAYLRDRTADLLDAVNGKLPMKSKSNILHEALEEYVASNFEDVECDSIKSIGASDVPNSKNRVVKIRDSDIVTPSEIDSYALDVSEFSVSQDSTSCKVVYSSCEDSFTVSHDGECFDLINSVGSEDTVIESYKCAEPVLVHLSSCLRDSEGSLLSDKEFRVWWLSRSNEYSQVAEWLEISEETVNTHITNIRNKMELAERTVNDLTDRQ